MTWLIRMSLGPELVLLEQAASNRTGGAVQMLFGQLESSLNLYVCVFLRMYL